MEVMLLKVNKFFTSL